MRCGACCFLRGICVFRGYSLIRVASSSLRLRPRSVGPQKSGGREHRGDSSADMSSPFGISLPPSPPPLPSLHTCGHPNGTRLGDHYLIVIADDPLVVSDTIIAIVVVILSRAARTLVHSAIRSRGEPRRSRGQHTRGISSMLKTRGLGISLSLVRACRRERPIVEEPAESR